MSKNHNHRRRVRKTIIRELIYVLRDLLKRPQYHEQLAEAIINSEVFELALHMQVNALDCEQTGEEIPLEVTRNERYYVNE